MTNREVKKDMKALKIVVEVAELCGKAGVAVAKEGKEEEILEAVYQMQDYYNDVFLGVRAED